MPARTDQRFWKILAGGVLAALVLAGCGGSGGQGAGAGVNASPEANSSAASGSAQPEATVVSRAAALAGLSALTAAGDAVANAAQQGKAAAQRAATKVEPAWAAIEGRVKQDSEQIYLQFEDALGLLNRAARNGDAQAAKDAAASLDKAAAAYRAQFGS